MLLRDAGQMPCDPLGSFVSFATLLLWSDCEPLDALDQRTSTLARWIPHPTPSVGRTTRTKGAHLPGSPESRVRSLDFLCWRSFR